MTTQAKSPPAVPTAPTAPPVKAVSGRAASPPRVRKFTVAEYYRMAEVGILEPDERVELIEGEIIVIPPIGPEHAWNVDFASDFITRRLDERLIVRSQKSGSPE